MLITKFWELYPAVFEASVFKTEDERLGFYDVYLGRFVGVSKKKLDSISKGGGYGDFKELYNVEHIIPTTIYGDKEEIMFDLHNTVPSIKVINDIRSTLPIGIIPAGKKVTRTISMKDGLVSDEVGGDGAIAAKISIGRAIGKHNRKSRLFKGESYEFTGCLTDCHFEPADTPFRGLIARSILYFHSKYLSSIKTLKNRVIYLTSVLSLMREWDTQYGPTPYEINRNLQIYKRTGTINPFFQDAMKRERMPKAMRYLLDYSTEPIRMAIIKKIIEEWK
jgi:endonuclease I